MHDDQRCQRPGQIGVAVLPELEHGAVGFAVDGGQLVDSEHPKLHERGACRVEARRKRAPVQVARDRDRNGHGIKGGMAEVRGRLLPGGAFQRLPRRRLRQAPRNSDEEQEREVDEHQRVEPIVRQPLRAWQRVSHPIAVGQTKDDEPRGKPMQPTRDSPPRFGCRPNGHDDGLPQHDTELSRVLGDGRMDQAACSLR